MDVQRWNGTPFVRSWSLAFLGRRHNGLAPRLPSRSPCRPPRLLHTSTLSPVHGAAARPSLLIDCRRSMSRAATRLARRWCSGYGCMFATFVVNRSRGSGESSWYPDRLLDIWLDSAPFTHEYVFHRNQGINLLSSYIVSTNETMSSGNADIYYPYTHTLQSTLEQEERKKERGVY